MEVFFNIIVPLLTSGGILYLLLDKLVLSKKEKVEVKGGEIDNQEKGLGFQEKLDEYQEKRLEGLLEQIEKKNQELEEKNLMIQELQKKLDETQKELIEALKQNAELQKEVVESRAEAAKICNMACIKSTDCKDFYSIYNK